LLSLENWFFPKKLNTSLSYIYAMNEENGIPENLRIVFRPTDEQYRRIMVIMGLGKFKHMSELIRHVLEIGLDDLEKRHNIC